MATPTNLDDLSGLSYDDLGMLYASGKVPADFTALDNNPKGRMLSVRGIEKTPLQSLVTEVSKLGFFPWDGKSMESTGTQSGDGINRINLGAKMNWFPFKTSVQKSIIDGRDTIVLDYEQPGNPFFVRRIHDEIREVSPGLFLGPAMLKTGEGKAATVLWFALDTNSPSS